MKNLTINTKSIILLGATALAIPMVNVWGQIAGKELYYYISNF